MFVDEKVEEMLRARKKMGTGSALGKIFGKKIIYIETFANINKKTLTGKIIYPVADLFIVQWKKMLEFYPKAVYVCKYNLEV